MRWLWKLMRRLAGNQSDPTWKPTGIKPAERTWAIDRDHDDPRARKQLMAEVKARRVQAERHGKAPADGSNVVPIRRKA